MKRIIRTNRYSPRDGSAANGSGVRFRRMNHGHYPVHPAKEHSLQLSISYRLDPSQPPNLALKETRRKVYKPTQASSTLLSLNHRRHRPLELRLPPNHSRRLPPEHLQYLPPNHSRARPCSGIMNARPPSAPRGTASPRSASTPTAPRSSLPSTGQGQDTRLTPTRYAPRSG